MYKLSRHIGRSSFIDWGTYASQYGSTRDNIAGLVDRFAKESKKQATSSYVGGSTTVLVEVEHDGGSGEGTGEDNGEGVNGHESGEGWGTTGDKGRDISAEDGSSEAGEEGDEEGNVNMVEVGKVLAVLEDEVQVNGNDGLVGPDGDWIKVRSLHSLLVWLHLLIPASEKACEYYEQVTFHPSYR